MKPGKQQPGPNGGSWDTVEPDRRRFLQRAAVTTTAALGTALLGTLPRGTAAAEGKPADAAVKALYDSLSEAQKKAFAFDWDRKGYGDLPLRLHVTNNWAVSNTKVGDLAKDQQGWLRRSFGASSIPDGRKSWPGRRRTIRARPGPRTARSPCSAAPRAGSASASSPAFT